ncbi:hypothetical protein K6W36_02985 [Acetobacter senegalensis]|uniref:hypothetical protein n=1 Tax=Acetobacter senegalensis TaxID=446692 RepID=UPI001EDAD415|nr:hypothetical protein [Acetobacter senegalensis]MCG4259551.1 hypothetical protein [Acetobacter senegalensis]
MQAPELVRDIFATQATNTVVASFFPGHFQSTVIFFGIELTECDLDPRDIHDAETFQMLQDTLKTITRITSRPAFLTEENGPESILWHYDPACIHNIRQ